MDGLTDFSEIPDLPAKRRGPRSALTDEQILVRREQLVQVFEGRWGELGWELRKCKNPGELIRIFSSLDAAFIQYMISVLCRNSSVQASAMTVRKVRATNCALMMRCQNVEDLFRDAALLQERVNWDLFQLPDDEVQRGREELERCQADTWSKKKECEALCEQQKLIQEQLSDLEASFARDELYRFCKSQRYELNPLNLANAVAGLPFMGWRQSARRCKPMSSASVNGLDYQIFKAIRFITASVSTKTERVLIDEFPQRIQQLPSRYRMPRAALARNWYYLERAIRQAFKTKLHPKALEFELTKQYFRRLLSRNQLDINLAPRSEIELSRGRKRVPNHSLNDEFRSMSTPTIDNIEQ